LFALIAACLLLFSNTARGNSDDNEQASQKAWLIVFIFSGVAILSAHMIISVSTNFNLLPVMGQPYPFLGRQGSFITFFGLPFFMLLSLWYPQQKAAVQAGDDVVPMANSLSDAAYKLAKTGLPKTARVMKKLKQRRKNEGGKPYLFIPDTELKHYQPLPVGEYQTIKTRIIAFIWLDEDKPEQPLTIRYINDGGNSVTLPPLSLPLKLDFLAHDSATQTEGIAGSIVGENSLTMDCRDAKLSCIFEQQFAGGYDIYLAEKQLVISLTNNNGESILQLSVPVDGIDVVSLHLNGQAIERQVNQVVLPKWYNLGTACKLYAVHPAAGGFKMLGVAEHGSGTDSYRTLSQFVFASVDGEDEFLQAEPPENINEWLGNADLSAFVQLAKLIDEPEAGFSDNRAFICSSSDLGIYWGNVLILPATVEGLN
ncbi:MAG: hypothetical protein MJK04_27015, partial [Psychrosphaera sp.]|nr:hypothetical protein [Psychrosphaera sp.]